MESDEFERAVRQAATYAECVRAVADFFASRELYYGHGTDNPDDEAHWLVAALLDWDDSRWQAPPEPALCDRIVAVALERVESRMPLAYLLGEAWFAGLRFEIDRSVLVPRSPLAEIIEHCFSPWVGIAPGDRVLEIGTGSGCIAIATACRCPDVTVDATDVAVDAISLARRNACAHGVGERVRIVQADLFPGGTLAYRVIISNPPYVPESRLAELPAEYSHEPVLGLAGGADGLDVVRRIMREARSRLERGGALIVEVGESQQAFEAAYPRLPVTWVEFEHGGSGVFVVTYEQLEEAGL